MSAVAAHCQFGPEGRQCSSKLSIVGSQASKSFEHVRPERDSQAHSPVLRALAVPEWLNSPRSSSAASWQSSDPARSGSVTAEASFESPRRRSARSLGNVHSAFMSSDPSTETVTDARQDPRYSEDSQGLPEAGRALEAPSGNKTEVHCHKMAWL